MSKRRVAAELRRFLMDEVFDGRTQDDDPFAAGLIDSLALEQLASFAEERFGADLADEDMAAERIASVEAFAGLVLASAAGAART